MDPFHIYHGSIGHYYARAKITSLAKAITKNRSRIQLKKLLICLQHNA